MRITIVAPRFDLPSGHSRFVVGSFAAHVGLAIAFFWVPTWWRGPIVPPDAMMVELVGALPEPPSAAPPAESEAAPAEPEPPKEEIALATPPEVKPKTTPKPKATPKPEPATPRPSATPVANPDATGSGTSGKTTEAATAGSAASGGSVSALEGLDSAFGWYRAAVTQALYGRWQRPIVDGLTGPVEVRVAFEIYRNGQVAGLRIEQPSGIPTLDRSALRAVSDASPLPPLPAGLGELLPASFVFRLYPEGP